MPLSNRKKIVIISLIAFIGIIILLSIIYHRTSLWKPEQQLITLLPENPVGYVSFKEVEGFVQTFTGSEFGQQMSEIPLIAKIKTQLWWRQLVDQKQLWEYEMGGKLDLQAVKAYFGEETILALYRRDEEITFLLISALGATEKLAIEAMTATDAINPKYRRTRTEHAGFTINTITGYPRDFSYAFIGKIGILSLSYPLLTEVLDIYMGKKQHFLQQHPMQETIQRDYGRDKSTVYMDIPRLLTSFVKTNERLLHFVEQVHPLLGKTEFWTLGNRYEDGIILSRHRVRNQTKEGANVSTFPQLHPGISALLPERTALVTAVPLSSQIETFVPNLDLSEYLGAELVLGLIAAEAEQLSVVPSVILLAPVKAAGGLRAELENLKARKISIAGQPLQFLAPQDYRGTRLHPFQLRFNFLLALTGGYAVVKDYLVFSTTLASLKSVVDASLAPTPTLTDAVLNTKAGSMQTFVQPHLFVPELKRFLVMVTLLTSLSGQDSDAELIEQFQENLFPLEALGPISAEVRRTEDGVDIEFRIVLEE